MVCLTSAASREPAYRAHAERSTKPLTRTARVLGLLALTIPARDPAHVAAVTTNSLGIRLVRLAPGAFATGSTEGD